MTTSNVVEAFKVYEEVRKPVAQDVHDRSVKMGYLMDFHPDYIPADADIEKVRAGDKDHLEKVAMAMDDVWSFHFSKMPEGDWDKAKEKLAQVLGH